MFKANKNRCLYETIEKVRQKNWLTDSTLEKQIYEKLRKKDDLEKVLGFIRNMDQYDFVQIMENII